MRAVQSRALGGECEDANRNSGILASRRRMGLSSWWCASLSAGGRRTLREIASCWCDMHERWSQCLLRSRDNDDEAYRRRSHLYQQTPRRLVLSPDEVAHAAAAVGVEWRSKTKKFASGSWHSPLPRRRNASEKNDRDHDHGTTRRLMSLSSGRKSPKQCLCQDAFIQPSRTFVSKEVKSTAPPALATLFLYT